MITLQTLFLGSSLAAWLKALAVLAAGCLLLSLVRRFILKRSARTGKETSLLYKLAKDFKPLSVLVLAAAAGALFLNIPPKTQNILRVVLITVAGFQIASWASTLLEEWMLKQMADADEDDPSRRTSIRVFGVVLKVAIWLIIILIILDNIPNLDLASMITGLGIGGIAVGLAAQSFLGDLLSSLTIALDKPYAVGDSIQVDKFSGTVEKIGIRSTHLRSIDGEQVVMSNSDLLSSRLQHFDRMQERRVVFEIRLDYATPAETLARIPDILREEIESQPNTRFARAHFKRFGEVNLIFEVVYFVTTPAYLDHVNAQHAINLAVHSRFEKEGIRFNTASQNVALLNANPDEILQ